MGIVVAFVVLIFWAANLFFSLNFVEIGWSSPFMYVFFLVQTYLYTGLFITGHDAMHGTIAPGNKKLNDVLGFVVVTLYAGMSYRNLKTQHKLHHDFPASAKDPDYSTDNQHFLVWWFRFMLKYLTIIQIVIMAVAFNVLKLWFTDAQIIIFWVAPAILSTFQLFYFGTFLPHRRPHKAEMTEHKARTQKKNHWWAMISCYFFGYHLEHHLYPHIPWWQLYKTKQHD